LSGGVTGIALPTARLRLAAWHVRRGGVIAYPTEAVYGVGCDPRNPDAVRRVLAIKGRPEGKGLILIASDFGQLEPFVERLAGPRMDEIEDSWPGPVTWLMPARSQTPRWLTGRHDTLAVRLTSHPLASALCRHAGSALVSTSANRSLRRPARNPLQVGLRLGGEVDYILTGICGERARPSTIRDGRTGAVVRA
jgi:L-threonylcarbamoyladenylate synthase